MEPQTRPLNGANLEGETPADGPNSRGAGGTILNTLEPATNSFKPLDATPVSGGLMSISRVGVGSVIDGYAILEFIGRGGMGVVFKALQPGSGQTVAVKMIRDSLFAGAEASDRFDREFKALGRLQSVKNIVPIYHVGQYEEGRFLVMPFFPGGNLAKHLTRYMGDPRKAVATVEKLARAVHQLHLQRILHRDIKPANVLLDADEEPYLADFGLVKLLDDEHSLTQTQERLGTPAYMAPEQTGLVPTPTSAQTDIWALGVLLYETLTGSRPFCASTEDDSRSLFWKIIHEMPPKPCKLLPNLDSALEAVILKCLEKDPSHRFGSAEELADELARWLCEERLQTSPTTLATRIRRTIRRRPRLASFLILLAISPMVAVAVVWRSSPEQVLKQLRTELQETGTLALVGEQGPPRWHNLAIDNRVNIFTDAYDRYWTIETWEVGLVELLRDVPFASYKVTAEIRHQKSDPRSGQYQGHVGIFVAHEAKSTSPKTPHFLCNLIYNDQVENKPPKQDPGFPTGNTANLKYRVYADTGIPVPVDELLGWTRPARFICAGRVEKQNVPWRVLEIAVHPNLIVCQFDGAPMAPLDRASADRAFRTILSERQKQYPEKFGPLGDVKNLELSQCGSLGLVVSKGAIAVKNVTVSRIHTND